MPKSKRQRMKPFTQINKKSMELKKQVVESVRSAIDTYSSIFTFSFNNMRTNHFKIVRMDLPDSRFFLGKCKVMKVALGRTKEEEYAENLHKMVDVRKEFNFK